MTTAPPELIRHGSPWKNFIAQWDISHFSIPLAFAAFAAMWKSACMFLTRMSIPHPVYIVLWAYAIVMLAIVLVLYIFRLIIWPGALRWDFASPRLVNFFFAPVIIGSLLVIGGPSSIMSALSRKVAFYVLATYQLSLSVYLYGEWLFGSVLIDVVHPMVFMQVIGYFLLSNIASSVIMTEEALALFSVGALFWVLIFVTNFQHLSSTLSRRAERPAPTYFLFIAPPAQAAIALAQLFAVFGPNPNVESGILSLLPTAPPGWPIPALVVLYVDLFLYIVIVRVLPSFWTLKFGVAYWAYIFPLSAAASATIIRGRNESTLFWLVVSGLLVAFASSAMIIVSIATSWGVWAGRIPNNPPALRAYRKYVELLRENKVANGREDVAIDGTSVSLPVIAEP